jgi:triacylglycerol lipase
MACSFDTLVRTLGAGLVVASVAACGASDADTAAATESNLTQSSAEEHYPIVLAHGFFGWSNFAGSDFLTYFFHVKDDLAAHGETQVFTPEVDPFNDSTTRGAQLEARILEILAQTGAKKVNIIGHSQGGLDARVVAHNRPDIVASVTTIATPHHGSHLANDVFDLTDIPIVGNIGRDLIDALVRIIGAPIWDQIGNETSVAKAIHQVTTDGMRDFNQRYPDVAGIRYASIAGRTAESDGGSDCEVGGSPGFIAKSNKMYDETDLLLKVPELVTSGFPFDDEPNDGFVRVSEARWGTFLGCVPADHFDEIGQLAGDRPGGDNTWDYLAFYRDLVGQLRADGL